MASGTRFVRLLACALPLALATAPALAEKTDVVVLLNGDHITGEVTELSYGQLKLKTDDAGTVYIEWDKIASVESTQLLQIELADGRRFFGFAAEAASTPQTLRIVDSRPGKSPVPVEVPMSAIVRLARIEVGSAWYERLEGDLRVGYSYTQANSVETASFSANVGVRNTRRKLNLALEGQHTSQQSGPPSQRASAIGTFERFLPRRYYRELSIEFTRNEELGLDLRSLVSMSFGRYLVQRPGREWRVGTGLALSEELGTDGSRRQNIEAVLTSGARLFRFDSPKTNVTANITLLPSLSDWGRVRGEASLQLQHELVSDLFFEVSFADSYDNQPAETAQTNDWNVATSLGYSF
jgi:hypothetical protein